MAFYEINRLTWQSSMLYSGNAGSYLPSQPVSYLRIAALMCDALASSRSRILGVQKLLDVTLQADGVQKTASALREQANQWREVDDNSGAFVIIEQCQTSFGFIDRFYKQVMRQTVI